MIDVLQLIILALFTSLVSMGIYTVCKEKNDLIFSFVGKRYGWFVEKRKEKYGQHKAEGYFWLVNPLFQCPYCVSSFWSVVIYAVFVPITWTCLIELPLTMLAVLTLNSILVKIIYPNGI